MSATPADTMRRVCCLAVLLSVVAATLEVDKRAEISSMPFVLGSRYGRSPRELSELAPRPRVMAPRMDRLQDVSFFMGSRYGKRSPTADREEAASDPRTPLGAERPRLVCEFTGVYQLYRCENRQNILNDRPLASRRKENITPTDVEEE